MRPADERFCRHTSRHYARDRCYISFFLDDHRTSRLMQHLCQPQEKPLKPLIAACPRSLTVLACFSSPCVLSGTTSCAARLRSPMACKVKGIFKGLKAFSRIFAVKEHEMEIGCPTDVKHVAHIGWDSAAGGASPSWMNDIMASSDLSSLGNFAALTGTSWVSQGTVTISSCSPEGSRAAFLPSWFLPCAADTRSVADSVCLTDLDSQQRVVAENTGRRDHSATCPDITRPPRNPGTKKPRDGSPPASPPSPAARVDAAADDAR
ncbi:CRIB domain-containing protein RIC10 [Zea mays]|uniref:CRIB domain-containing protein RIC10 n=1 Tax=Zea mays TaxID=4577 RepID=A0A1D6DXN5_MAIZE|nr:CRIB domain-containing protein RIC10 [Zea mays]